MDCEGLHCTTEMTIQLQRTTCGRGLQKTTADYSGPNTKDYSDYSGYSRQQYTASHRRPQRTIADHKGDYSVTKQTIMD